ncbi:MAG TPA: hypothetical protein VGO45_03755 [Bacteroidia bacterium]|jgi:hypothetical protein|nr:hypothetical protein [Bacteroidia bacterium]
MKKTSLFFCAISLALLTNTMQAQKWSQGKDFAFLKGQKELNLEYNYDKLVISKNETPEDDYIKDKVAKGNEKEPGKGDKWLVGWQKARKNSYQPKFEDLLNKTLGDGISAGEGKTTAKYTMIVRTVMIEPGFNVGVMKKPADADFDILIVETADHSKVKAKGTVNNVPGSNFSGGDFDATARIQECYAKAGKMIGKSIAKAIE